MALTQEKIKQLNDMERNQRIKYLDDEINHLERSAEYYRQVADDKESLAEDKKLQREALR